MANLKNIKLKIQSVKKTRQVTKAMEAVSAVKMRKAQEQALGARPYAVSALEILKRVSGGIDALNHPLTQETARSGKTCMVAITSDKGLAGPLNSALLRRIDSEIRKREITPDNAVVVAVGRRGADHFAKRGYDVRERHENVTDNVSLDTMESITRNVLAWHAQGEIDSCVVTYTNFVSTFEQQPVVRRIIPITPNVIEEVVAGIAPQRDAFTEMQQKEEGVQRSSVPGVYTIEPTAEEVLAAILPRLVGVFMFHALAEAKASEHSARMVAMKNATDKAGEVTHDLTLAFNKARQAAITSEVSEITSGIEAMR